MPPTEEVSSSVITALFRWLFSKKETVSEQQEKVRQQELQEIKIKELHTTLEILTLEREIVSSFQIYMGLKI